MCIRDRVYSDEIEDKIDSISDALQKRYPEIIHVRWCAIKLLEGDKEISEKYPVDLPQVLDSSYVSEIINQKYEFIEEIVQEVLVDKEEKAQSTDKADRILTHPIFGIPIFLGIMALVFLLTFTVGDFISGYFELAVEDVYKRQHYLYGLCDIGSFGYDKWYVRGIGERCGIFDSFAASLCCRNYTGGICAWKTIWRCSSLALLLDCGDDCIAYSDFLNLQAKPFYSNM